MRLRALLESGTLGLRLLGGGEELDRTVRGVMTTDLRDPSRYLSGGELVLTGLAWRHAPEDSESFVRIVAEAGVAALAAGEAELGPVPEDLVAACARYRVPLFSVSESVAFATITEHIVRQVSGERAGDLAAVVDRHRKLMTGGPAGGPGAVLDLLGNDLDLHAWVLSATGRELAGSARTGAPALAPEVRETLASARLDAVRTGRLGAQRVTVGDTVYSLFPVHSTTPSPLDAHRAGLGQWVLAVAADASDWPAERRELLDGVTQLIAVERDRRDAGRSVRRRLAGEVLDLVQSGAPAAETAARLRAAGPLLLPGASSAPYWQIVVASVEWEGETPSETTGRLARGLLEEVLAGSTGARGRAAADGPPEPTATDLTGPEDEDEAADHAAVTQLGAEAVALVPLPARSGDEEHAGAELDAAGLVGPAGAPLAAGLGAEGRLTLGVSAAVHSAEGLRGALEEARHARRVAAARPGPVTAAGHQELASHVLLLPFVPDDVRRAFTARLLDPLRVYDRRHRAELIPTLEAFLDSDGSWTRCAARLHLHVNTLRYRVGRIEQLTGRDLSRLEDKLDFFLALRMS
ncbi:MULTISPECIES: PucR family transcriptional regulator ligand-binding domain-containing protein [unclassified Streptomyces]|uniref:helix-turn-helix domain-containing protein n=1 Tax=unclassified Streptomyces TaxID=2593676 RepID=UPI00081EC322|nr:MULTISPECIES: PucR family transcriptional regulator ligand-binding domain-containing protein [unclassified Streptomyces]MYR25196.1 PucR family transcriptional regulator [Streptomyces sp. SID4945]SCE76169.1 PucR C-terminal helix-turn-helix domain-containing protein [Streptomyces sp. LcepLS]